MFELWREQMINTITTVVTFACLCWTIYAVRRLRKAQDWYEREAEKMRLIAEQYTENVKQVSIYIEKGLERQENDRT